MKTKKNILGAGWIVVITLLLRLPYVFLIPILSVDEAYIATAASMINSSGTLYVDVISDKPPLTIYLYALIFRLIGANSLLSIQILGVAWTLLATFVLYRVTQMLGGNKAGFAAAVFYAVGSTTFNPPDMIAAKYDLFMVLPLALSVLFFLQGLKERRARGYLLAGLFCGTGFLFKHSGAANLGAMVLFLILTALAGGATIREAGKRSALVLAGFSVPVALTLVCFFSRGALKEFYSWGWIYGFRYAAQVPLGEGARTALKMIGNLVAPNFAFWILALSSIFALRRSNFKTGYAFCWLWGLFSLAGAAAGRRPCHYYYIQAIPPFAVLAGLGAAAALDPAVPWSKKQWRRTALKAAIALSLTTAILITHRLQPHTLEWMYGVEYRRFYLFKKVEHPGQRLADHIRQNSLESDSIYAWGYYPEYYILSGRHAAAQSIVGDYIVGTSPGGMASRPILIPGVKERFLEDLESSRPVYFIDTSMSVTNGYFAEHPVARYPLLWKFLQTNYELESVIDGNLIYRRRERPPDEPKPFFLEAEGGRRTILDATRALEINPKFVQAYFFRGKAYYRLGSDRAALEDFNRALDLFPSRNIFFHRGLVYSRLGEGDAAERDFNAALGGASR